MKKFKVGDRVRSIKSSRLGEVGTVLATNLGGLVDEYITVKYDNGFDGLKLPENLELIQDEPTRHIIHCGLCSHEYKLSMKIHSATIKCDCGADLDYFKFDDGRISITTTTEVKIDDERDTDPDTD